MSLPVVMALFQTAPAADMAIAELSLNGFDEKHVSVILFSAAGEKKSLAKAGLFGWLARGGFLGDTIDQSDGHSVMDGVGVGAVIFALLGIVYGSHWTYGPIAGATAGLLLGGLLGYIADLLVPEKRRDQLETSLIDGLILVQVSHPDAARTEAAKRLLQGNRAKQLAVLPEPDSRSGGDPVCPT